MGRKKRKRDDTVKTFRSPPKEIRINNQVTIWVHEDVSIGPGKYAPRAVHKID